MVMAQTFETFAHWVIRPPCINSLRFPDSPWLRVSVVNFHPHFLGSTSSKFRFVPFVHFRGHQLPFSGSTAIGASPKDRSETGAPNTGRV